MTHPLAPKVPLSDAGRMNWLRLIRSENVGPVTFIQLMNRYGSAGEALAALPDLAARGGARRRIKLCSRANAEQEMERAANAGTHMLCLGAADYPPLLAQIEAPPPMLWALGKLRLAEPDAVAIVGARNASAIGQKFAARLASELGDARIVVVSGMARGLDRAAHEAALKGGTIAVLGGGVDNIYPQENANLHARLREEGLILSDAPMGYQPQSRDFPRRNRTIAGLSLGVVVAEAAERSGSLITARLAGELGREVMAVPGSPMDARASGANHLIREGATLVRGVGDVLEAIEAARGRSFAAPAQPSLPFFEEPSEADLDAARVKLLQALSPTPGDIDDLLRVTGLAPGPVALVLLELELAGRLVREPGGKVALLPE